MGPLSFSRLRRQFGLEPLARTGSFWATKKPELEHRHFGDMSSGFARLTGNNPRIPQDFIALRQSL